MIRPVSNFISRAPAVPPRQPAAPGTAAPRNRFLDLFRSRAASAPARQPSALSAAPAPRAPQPRAALPASPTGLPDDFAPATFERRMNNWLLDQLDRQNQAKLEIYNRAVENWKLNEARRQELGLPSESAPQAPALTPLEPKPAGWWFQPGSEGAQS